MNAKKNSTTLLNLTAVCRFIENGSEKSIYYHFLSSNANKSGSVAIQAEQKIVSDLKNRGMNIKKVCRITDNCAREFKSKSHLMEAMKQEDGVERMYVFKTSKHGKGRVDGAHAKVAATIKEGSYANRCGTLNDLVSCLREEENKVAEREKEERNENGFLGRVYVRLDAKKLQDDKDTSVDLPSTRNIKMIKINTEEQTVFCKDRICHCDPCRSGDLADCNDKRGNSFQRSVTQIGEKREIEQVEQPQQETISARDLLPSEVMKNYLYSRSDFNHLVANQINGEQNKKLSILWPASSDIGVQKSELKKAVSGKEIILQPVLIPPTRDNIGHAALVKINVKNNTLSVINPNIDTSVENQLVLDSVKDKFARW